MYEDLNPDLFLADFGIFGGIFGFFSEFCDFFQTFGIFGGDFGDLLEILGPFLGGVLGILFYIWIFF